MSTTHQKLPKLFWVQLLLVAIVAALYFYYSVSDKTHGEATGETNPKAHAATKTLKPVGNVALTSNKANTGDKQARSGEQVFNAACTVCHTAGVANAPKPDDKAAWEPRVAQGLETLVKTAISGKGAMPPRGGNPAITDEELKNAIIYMTTKAGFNLTSASSALSTSENTNSAPEVKSATRSDTSKIEIKPVSIAQHAKPATPPIQAAAPTTAEPPHPVAAPTPPTPPTPPEEVMEKVVAVATSPAVAAAASTSKSADPGSTTSLKEGEKIYKKTCFACHATGVAGAPKLEDKANWAPRIASGKDALYHSALNGKGVMPPKGGNIGLGDNVVKAAVDYMVSQAQ